MKINGKKYCPDVDSNHGLQIDEVGPLIIAFPSTIDVGDPGGSHPSGPVLCPDVLPLHHLGEYCIRCVIEMSYNIRCVNNVPYNNVPWLPARTNTVGRRPLLEMEYLIMQTYIQAYGTDSAPPLNGSFDVRCCVSNAKHHGLPRPGIEHMVSRIARPTAVCPVPSRTESSPKLDFDEGRRNSKRIGSYSDMLIHGTT